MKPVHSFRQFGLAAALNVDWHRLVDAEDPRRRWYLCPELRRCGDLDEVLNSIRRSPDPVLAVLLRLSIDGDQLAGRTVLQSMLGRLVGFARVDPHAGLDDYVTAMWLRIRTYPLAERPTRIGANLALDTLKAVKRRDRVAGAVDVSPYPPELLIELLDGVQPAEADVVRAGPLLDAAARLGVISAETRAVLTSVYVDGLTGVAAAERHGKSAGAIRVQCHSALRRLAVHRAALAEAA